MTVGTTVLVTPAVGGAAEPEIARPAGANPFLSVVGDPASVDVAAWRRYLNQQSKKNAKGVTTEGHSLVVNEREPAGTVGQNDTRAQAEAINGFGTTGTNRAMIVGQLSSSDTTADVDFYKVELRAGDIFAAKLEGEGHHLSIVDPAGVERQGSAQDFSSIYPAESPLPRGGNAIADHVASVSGTHYLAVAEGSGAYTVNIQVHRPSLEREPLPQIVFLDFDGAEIDTAIFGMDPGLHTLSRFSGFLQNWGLTAADEPAVVRQIMKTVRENLVEDIAARGNNPRTRLIVLNSLDHPDLFGHENVSRVVVGGTVEELGFTTIGIAQSIDPGNFAHEETAVVLQDFLSRPAGPGFSLNTYLQPQSNRIEFVGRAVANVISHEIGHYVGGWHTDPTNATVNLEDAGGAGYTGMFGTGPDSVGGTADDTDTAFAEDVYRPSEGFTGVEDSLNRMAFGLSGFRRR